MMAIERQPEPQALRENGERWTNNFLTRLAAHQKKSEHKRRPKPVFLWPQYNKEKLNQHLLPLLIQMTAAHCAYCDGFPMGIMSTETIDHFQPKERYPEKAYTWSNLFLCCNVCQKAKGSEYDDDLLAPDQPGYRFSDYFLFNFHTGEIEINPLAAPEMQRQAEITLKLLKLNENALPGYRRDIVEDQGRNPREINDRPYRFIFSE